MDIEIWRDKYEMKNNNKIRELETYDGVYMIYFRKGSVEKMDFGMNSKLQWPKLFMKSMYAR